MLVCFNACMICFFCERKKEKKCVCVIKKWREFISCISFLSFLLKESRKKIPCKKSRCLRFNIGVVVVADVEWSAWKKKLKQKYCMPCKKIAFHRVFTNNHFTHYYITKNKRNTFDYKSFKSKKKRLFACR